MSADTARSARATRLRQELFAKDLNVMEVSYILNVDRTTVLRYLRDGNLSGYQLGREWFIPEGRLRDYVDRLHSTRPKPHKSQKATP
jgi:excisionase family DNA binding protein